MTDQVIRPSILFVALSLERGGTENHLVALLPRLRAKGWPVSIYCIATRGELAENVAQSGVEVISPPLEGGSRFNGPAKVLRLGLTSLKLLFLMVWRRPPIVHFFLPGPYLIGAPLALLTLRPIRIMSRRNLNHYLSKRPLAARFELGLHRWMTAILGNSASIVNELIREEKCAPDKVGLIRNGVDIAAYEAPSDRGALRQNLGLDQSTFVGVIVANLNPYKGHADLVRALGSIAAQLPKPWVVLCAGRDDGAKAGIEALIAQHGLSDNIKLLGPRSDVPRLLAAADIGLLCSHEEGFSNAIVESMAAGLPMVVTAVGGNPEAIRHETDGLVVPARDPKALAAAILALALDPIRRQTMGSAASERARNLFSIEACVNAYDRLYLGLLTDQKAGSLAPMPPPVV